MKEIIIDDYEIYKKIKNRCIYVTNKEIEDIKIKKKIRIKNNKKSKKLKVIKIYNYDNLEKLQEKIKSKKNIICEKELKENKKVYGIELKKINSFKKICFYILIFTIILISIILLRNAILNIQNKSFNKKFKELQKEEIINVIVEINPSITLTIKDNKIIDSYCLNKDCNDLLKNMNTDYKKDINNQNLEYAINLFYEAAKKNNYNTDNGIVILSTNSKVKNLISETENIEYKHITKEEEYKLLKNNKNKLDELNKKEAAYNEELLKLLKKDINYDRTFTCGIYENQVKCYMKDFMTDIFSGNLETKDLVTLIPKLLTEYNDFKKLLDKFNVDYTFTGGFAEEPEKNITLSDGIKYGYADSAKSPIYNENGDIIDYFIIKYPLVPEDDIYNSNSETIELTKVDLISKTYDQKDVIIIDLSERPTIIRYGSDEK